MWAYGGDFGETYHDSNFCLNGLNWPDRGLGRALDFVYDPYQRKEFPKRMFISSHIYGLTSDLSCDNKQINVCYTQHLPFFFHLNIFYRRMMEFA